MRAQVLACGVTATIPHENSWFGQLVNNMCIVFAMGISLNASGGCDGGLCILPYFLVGAMWFGSGLVILLIIAIASVLNRPRKKAVLPPTGGINHIDE